MISSRLVAVVLVAALGRGGHAQDVAGFAKVAADDPVSVAMRAPGAWIERAVREARAILPDAMGVEIDLALQEIGEELGFAIADVDSWRGVGLDPDGVFTFSVGQPGGWLGLPRRLRAILSIHDAGLLAAYLADHYGDGSVEVREDGSGVGGSLAFRAVGREMAMAGRDDVDDVDRMQQELTSMVGALGAGQTIGSTAVHRAAAARLGGDAFVGLFVRPAALRGEGAGPDPDGQLSQVDSFLAAAGPRTLVAALRLRPDSVFAGELRRGADPRAVLRRLPQPTAVVTLSVADPYALFRALVDVESSLGRIPFAFDALLEALGVDLKGGCVGGAAYPGPADGVPSWVVFAAVRDQGRAIAKLDELLRDSPDDAQRLGAPDGARLWLDPDDGVVLGVSEGTVFVGTAVDQVAATIRGESDGHEPALRGDGLLEFDIALSVLRALPGPIAAGAPAALSEGRITGRIEVDDGIVVASVERVGGSGGATSWVSEALAWAAWINAGERVRTAPDTALAEVRRLHQTVILYTVKNGRLPTIEDLLEHDPTGGPFVEGGKVPIDPWGTPYQLRKLPGRLRFEVVSYGPDGLADTDDDIVHPTRR